MKDNDFLSEGYDVAGTKLFDMTAMKKTTNRLEKRSGAEKFAETEDNLIAARRQRKAPACDVADQIGLRLRIVYDDVLTQPVPDRFFELLKQLENKSASDKRNDL